MVVAKSFNLKDVTEYNSETTQYYKLSQRYGSGEIKLIPNTKVGIGNEIKYCSVSEAKNLKLGDIYIINIFEELAPFTIGGFKQHIINYKYKLKMNIDSNQRTLFGGG
jgi:hypothetical protein